jgi:hypothetical protein
MYVTAADSWLLLVKHETCSEENRTQEAALLRRKLLAI